MPSVIQRKKRPKAWTKKKQRAANARWLKTPNGKQYQRLVNFRRAYKKASERYIAAWESLNA
jgi:hypothetical protein